MGAGPDILDAAAQYNLIISFGRFFMVVSMMLNSAFRGYGDTKTPLLVNTVMNIVNVIFNFLLIYPTREISLFGSSFTVYGAGLEVNGAAIASSLGMAVAGLMTLWVAFFRKNEYQIQDIIQIFLTTGAAALTSSMGIFLAPIMVALGAFAGIIQTRKIGIAWKLLAGCIPCIILTGIYLLLRVEGMG